jgi:2,4-dienoyl-CoA reductase-like NADH-dependent reductase (Old Yellow Enzyme family)
MTDSILGAPLQLRRGAPIPNRLLKSAMSEILGTPTHAPTAGLPALYGTWARGGIGLSITGNVMIDRRALGEPANVVVEDERDLEALTAWAAAGTSAGGHLWMQINHPGKQSPITLTKAPVAPSAVPLGRGLEKAFATPRALTDDEIEDLIERYGRTAAVAQKAGFTGVQLHGAHGYLVSQFLSPHHNRRTDKWGGSLENRAAFVMRAYQSMRRAVGEDFPVGIKINSADFQKGGFSEEESIEVIAGLVDAGMDLVEISGGTYEAPAMTGARRRESTKRREAYFLAFAETLRKRVDVPLAVTGGFRTAEGMRDAVSSGAVDMVGLARAMALDPELPNRVLGGEDFQSAVRALSTGIKTLDRIAMLDVTYYENQLALMAAGKPTRPGMGVWASFFMTLWRMGWQSFRQRRAKA